MKKTLVRAWSLITGMGVATKRGVHEVLPLQKGGAEKVLAMMTGGGTKSFGVVLWGSLKY